MITSEREEVMDATLPYYYDNFAVIYKRPDPEENLWLTYFHPFSEEVKFSLEFFFFFLISQISGEQKFHHHGQKGWRMG